MTMRDGIFGQASNFEKRFIRDYKQLASVSQHLKELGFKIVLTSGSFDMIHMGHARYLEAAKKFGSFLIVGIDSDAKLKKRKGPDRPIVPEDERLMMLTHLRPVDVVTLKPEGAEHWALIKAVRPDVLVATTGTYSQAEIDELTNTALCGRVEVLQPMATTTTSARLRLLQIHFNNKLGAQLTTMLPSIIQQALDNAVGKKQV